MNANRRLPTFVDAPVGMATGLRNLGREWAAASVRPKISMEIRASWEHLLAEWVNSDLPLVIRKSGGVRGAASVHSSGRELVVADNSLAQWAFGQAFAGRVFTVESIRKLLADDAIPFTFATKSAEKVHMKYKCTLSPKDNVNKCGWKLCHIEEIGLSTRTPLTQVPLGDLVRHFTLLMSPSNHFVVPLGWSGLGEVNEFIAEVRQYDSRSTA
jgi:hypothetical protein